MDQEISGISRNELLTWLAEGGSKTLGYDAILAYDRTTVNKVFREQYIRRFNSGSYFPEITDVQRLPGGEFVFFERCILSEPWITFEGADITSATPSAKVSMQVLGGDEVKVAEASRQPDVLEVRQVNALNASVLESFIPIKKISENGLVGGIAIDLKEGVEYTLSQRNTQLESELGGMFFRDRFNQWGSNRTQFRLNDIKSNQGPLAIQDFTLRTQPAPGASNRNAVNYGDGAVLAFLTMPGGTQGTPPTHASQLKYLIPSDNPEPYTATTIIQARRVLITIAENMLRDGVILHPDSEYDIGFLGEEVIAFHNAQVLADIDPIFVAAHQFRLSPDRWWAGSILYVLPRLDMVRASQIEHTLKLSVQLNGTRWPLTAHAYGSGHLLYRGNAHAYGESSYSFGFKVGDGRNVIIEGRSSTLDGVRVAAGDYRSDLAPWSGFESELQVKFNEALPARMQQLNSQVTGFDLFILNSFLFSEPLSTYMREAVTPYDTAIFGHIAADFSKFELATPLHTMGQGGQHTFLVTEPQAGITWSVANLPGESGSVGQINAQTGVYTAPTAAQIPGLQKRVLISATRGQFTASGLLTVVRKPININPIVQWGALAKPGYPEIRGLNAGALDGNAITWGTIDPARGRLEVSNDGKRDRYFHPPAQVQPGVAVDVVPITVTAAGQTETAWILVKHADITLTIMQGPIANGAVALTAEFLDGQPLEVEWAVTGGSGSIDPRTGVLTSDATPTEPFALVTATLRSESGFVLLGHRLFGMPLVERIPPRAAALRHISLC